MPDASQQQRERLRSLVTYCLPILRKTARDRVTYLRDVTINAYAGRSRPADLCVMRDDQGRYVIEAVLIVTTREEWEAILADVDSMCPWLGAVQRVSVVVPGYSQAVPDDAVPEGWGLYEDDFRGSGFMFARRESALLNAPKPEFTLALRGPDGKRVRLEPDSSLDDAGA